MLNIKAEIKKIQEKKSYIGIIGLGYVGLPLAKEFLNSGFSVLGFDIDEEKVKKINQGINYLAHINGDVIKDFVNKGKLEATSDFKRLKEADVIIICLPTPLGDHQEPDLSYVLNTTRTISQNLRKGHIIILESTTYPGTTEEEMLPILEESGLKVGKDFFLGYSPEREDPGNPDFSTRNIPKIVSGVTKNCKEVIKTLYDQIVEKTVPVSSPRVAEAAKILENVYRAVNISLVNELKMVFDRMGINIWEVIEAAKTKPFGFTPFYPGPGMGGHCIPVDPFYLTWKAKEYGVHPRFIELSGQLNNQMPHYVVQKIQQALNSVEKPLKNSRILIVGIAYKKDVGDLRESPALKIIELLQREGAQVNYSDPYVPEIPKLRKFNFKMTSIPLTKNLIEKMDLVAIITDHSNIDYNLIKEHSKLIVDTRNVYKIKGIKEGKIWKA